MLIQFSKQDTNVLFVWGLAKRNIQALLTVSKGCPVIMMQIKSKQGNKTNCVIQSVYDELIVIECVYVDRFMLKLISTGSVHISLVYSQG